MPTPNTFSAVLALLATTALAASAQTMTLQGGQGPGAGKQIVLVSGDEEYRSEEVLPQLAKILATHHGFTCTVLFAINPDTGTIDPNYTENIPGLETLDAADLMIIFTRFRALPAEQMEHIDHYLRTGKPVLGIRTATHAFNFPEDSPWAHYGNGYSGDKKEWTDGFGRLVLGEKWITHHGHHKYESTRGMIAPGAAGGPIVRGIADGDIWGPTDVYGVRLPLPGDSTPIMLGQVLAHDDAYDEDDLMYGMRPDTGTPLEGEKNDPMMPIAWMKSYQVPGGEQGKVFTTTIGASTDFLNEGVRRLMVNAVYWCLDKEEAIPQAGTNVELVGAYEPTPFEFREPEYWAQRKMTIDQVQSTP